MSRLVFFIFFLFLIVLSYVAYLSKMALAENRASQAQLKSLEQLRTLVLTMAEGLQKPMTVAVSDPGLTQSALRRLEAFELTLASRPAGRENDSYQSALLLSRAARVKLEALVSGKSSDPDALNESLTYLVAAENLYWPRKEPAAKKNYRVHRGDTLWAISKKFYNTPWRWNDIWKLNASRLSAYKEMPPGIELALPD